MKHVVLLLGLAFACRSKDAPPPTTSSADLCEQPVTASIAKAFPGATLRGCVPEIEGGRRQFAVSLAKADGSHIGVDVSPDGAILQVEQPIAIEQLPPAVTSALAAKYPDRKPRRAEKQIRTGKGVWFEVALAGRTEATFAEDGTFVGDE